jgi:hypothetical protein
LKPIFGFVWKRTSAIPPSSHVTNSISL